MKKTDNKYGNKNLIETALDPMNAKVKVTLYLDGDLLLEIKKQANQNGKKYQTLLNEKLRQLVLNDQRTIGPDDFNRLSERVKILEKAIASE